MQTDAIIYIIGAGGHAKVVIDALLTSGVDKARLRVADNDLARSGSALLGVAVQGPAVQPVMAGALFHVAIGDCAARARLYAELSALGAVPLNVFHPASVVSAHATVGKAVFVAARAVIGPGAQLADGVIVNHGAVADHDCRVGAFSHLAPNATLGGAVTIGTQVLVGAGATILPGKSVGDNAIVGAGAVVLGHVPARLTWAGVPAVLLTKD